MRFTAVYFQNISSFQFSKFPQTYTQFGQCYPQSIVAKEKRVGKSCLHVSYSPVDTLVINFHYPQD